MQSAAYSLWYASIESVPDEKSHWDYINNVLLTLTERESVNKFVFIEDRKRALLSILLQRSVIRFVFSINDDSEYSISRTAQVY